MRGGESGVTRRGYVASQFLTLVLTRHLEGTRYTVHGTRYNPNPTEALTLPGHSQCRQRAIFLAPSNSSRKSRRLDRSW